MPCYKDRTVCYNSKTAFYNEGKIKIIMGSMVIYSYNFMYWGIIIVMLLFS